MHAAALAEPGALTPILNVRNGSTFVSFDAAQLTRSPLIHAAAVSAGPRQLAKNLNGAGDADDLLAVIKAQDASGMFRKFLAASLEPEPQGNASGEPLPPSLATITDEMLGDAAGIKAKDWTGKRVVLLVKDTNATSMALQVQQGRG